MASLSYYDPRHDDTYVIELEPDGSFSYCLRYVIGNGRDPIPYDFLADVPQPHRSEIEQLISQTCKPLDNR